MSFHFSKSFCIADRRIGGGQPIFIVAEAGLAHFGSLEKAKALVDMAAAAKADAVKFQVFKTHELISAASPEWIERLQPKELPFSAFKEIESYCREKGIIFFATAHDEPSLEFLDNLDVPALKIGSGEVGNWGFIKKVASRMKPVIISTGMYTLNEIRDALRIFAEAGNPDVAVLHCVTSYPTPPSEVNLNAIATIRKNLDIIVGYSDHTEGFHFPLSAAALGARIIEKHISLDFNVLNAQDWKVSCGPEDLVLMVRQIRDVEKGMGSGVKETGETERTSLEWARKSLVATRHIAAGEIIMSVHIQAKRPGYGISPACTNEVIGRKAKKNIKKDEVILWEVLV
jgi:N,N'-diacetyllegionaminate synthase